MQVYLWRIGADVTVSTLVAQVTHLQLLPLRAVPQYTSVALPSGFSIDTSLDSLETTYVIAWRPVQSSVVLRWHFTLLNESSTFTLAQPKGTLGQALRTVRDDDGSWKRFDGVPGSRLGVLKPACTEITTDNPRASSEAMGSVSERTVAIISSVFGLVAFALCCLVLALVCFRRRRKIKQREKTLDFSTAYDLGQDALPGLQDATVSEIHKSQDLSSPPNSTVTPVESDCLTANVSNLQPARLSSRSEPPSDVIVTLPRSPQQSAVGFACHALGNKESPTLDDVVEEVARLQAKRDAIVRSRWRPVDAVDHAVDHVIVVETREESDLERKTSKESSMFQCSRSMGYPHLVGTPSRHHYHMDSPSNNHVSTGTEANAASVGGPSTPCQRRIESILAALWALKLCKLSSLQACARALHATITN